MRQIVTRHLVKAFDIGINGNLYGGRMLDWIDECGAMYLKECYPHLRFATYLLAETVFHKPVKLGEMLLFLVTHVSTGRHSVRLKLAVERDEETVLSTEMVFVCIGKDGRKQEIPSNPA